MTVDMNFMVGGEAGQGVQVVGLLLGKALARGGYQIFSDQDYESRIKGGHNFCRVRVKDGNVGAIAEPVDMLIALNQESIDLHQQELVQGGIIIFDGEEKKDVSHTGTFFSVPMGKLAIESVGDKLMTNTVALGAALGMVAYDFELLAGVLRDHFGKGDIGENNVKAARAGYEYSQTKSQGAFHHHLRPVSDIKRMFLSGNDAISLGAIAAGCKFMAAYPMTPTSPIMEYLAAKSADFDLVMLHAEDEIAAINMVIGAAYAGVRAMTATSGSGFCLMVEGLGLAGMTETPIVVVEGQRPGPAIGLPTRTEQGDLEFVLHAHHGEFPRVVFAPATVEDGFWLTLKAFNLAEKYQVPAIILTDHYLAGAYATVDRFDLAKVTIDRGLLFHGNEAEQMDYKRHKITESGVSPRAFPGQSKALVVTDADEHNEEGHLIEDAATRTAQVDKRLRKLSGLKREIGLPRRYGPEKAETTLVGWGSSYGALQEAVDILDQQGDSVNLIHLNEIWPFPVEAVTAALDSAKRSFIIESNATAQLAHLIRAETGRQVSGRVLRYDGRPLTPAYIVAAMKKAGE